MDCIERCSNNKAFSSKVECYCYVIDKLTVFPFSFVEDLELPVIDPSGELGFSSLYLFVRIYNPNKFVACPNFLGDYSQSVWFWSEYVSNYVIAVWHSDM